MARNVQRSAVLPAVCLAAVCLSGCNYALNQSKRILVAPIVPPRARIYTHYTAPLIFPDNESLGDLDIEQERELLYFRLPVPYVPIDFSSGRMSIARAAQSLGLRRVVFADYEYINIIGVYKRAYVHIYGEAADPEPDSQPRN